MSLNDTRKVPGGVRKPLRPWVIGTGPNWTLPSCSSQARFSDRSIHALALDEQGVPAAVGARLLLPGSGAFAPGAPGGGACTGAGTAGLGGLIEASAGTAPAAALPRNTAAAVAPARPRSFSARMDEPQSTTLVRVAQPPLV